MGNKEIYNPINAIEDPEGYYDRAFENYVRPWIVPIVGNLAMKLTKPEVSFYNSESENEYFDQFKENTTLALTFTHRGLNRLHDPGSAAAAVFGTEALKKRISGIKVWAAIPYMTDPKIGPVINRLGTVPVIRSRDWPKYDVIPSEDQISRAKISLIEHSMRHLETPNSTLAVFPAGTKGGEGVREGIGLVMEQLSRTAVIPVALVSDNEKSEKLSGNVPKNLRIAFGEPVFTNSSSTSSDYTNEIDESLSIAAQSVGG